MPFISYRSPYYDLGVVIVPVEVVHKKIVSCTQNLWLRYMGIKLLTKWTK